MYRRQIKTGTSRGWVTGAQDHYGMADVCPDCAVDLDDQERWGWFWAIGVFVVGMIFLVVVLLAVK